jgi:8-oxo-dGTP pyrophosphatase MutT (NUDIX family)
MAEHEPRYAGVLAHHRGQVVLVREAYPRWGGAYWNIPSGRIEPDETPREGASRELAEETGLQVAPDDLTLHATTSVRSGATLSRAWNFRIDVVDPTLDVSDPDGLIQDARWFPRPEAVDLLGRLPYRPLAEPAVAALTGRVPSGAHWAYSGPDGPVVVTLPAS